MSNERDPQTELPPPLSTLIPSRWTSLAAAQAAVMRDVKYVQKTRVQNLSYTVATEADIIDALRPAMLEHGIVMAPTHVEVVGTGQWETKSGGTMNLIRLLVTYTFSHVDSGEQQNVVVATEAANSGDKGCFAAMTMAMKYALLEFFMIERGNDPELIAEHADQQNIEQFRRAVSYLEKCTDEIKLDETMERARNSANPETGQRTFSDSDIVDLVGHAERQRLRIRSNRKPDV